MKKINGFLKRFWRELLAIVAALAVLGPMMAPGYVLTLDLVWTPDRPAEWDSIGFNNAYLVLSFFHYLALILPGWVGEKIMLFSLFFSLFYLPLRFLPWIQTKTGRIFAALLYGLNPFVYSRMLAGQWLVLAGYALMPVFFAALAKFLKFPGLKSGLLLGLALTLVGLFSIHFLYLALIIFGLAAFGCLVVQRKNFAKLKMTARGILLAAGCFAVLNSYWIIPAVQRPAPIEARFDIANFEAFAAAGNGEIPAMLNVAALGGYWGEALGWSEYFVWPQATPVFWLALAAIAALIAWGARAQIKNKERRLSALALLFLGMAAYVAALGAAHTPFKDFNMFLYDNVPSWSGLRDSQKVAGILAFVYAVFAGIGTDSLVRAFARRIWIKRAATAAIIALPLAFGIYEFNGFSRQLEPVDYPAEWYRAKTVIDAAPAGEKVLVLPWHGYFSLDFNHQLIMANPAPNFFGRDRVVAARSIDAGALRDTEIDENYRRLDDLFGTETPPDAAAVREALRSQNIKYILIINNAREPKTGNWTDRPVAASLLSELKTEQIIAGRADLLKVLALD